MQNPLEERIVAGYGEDFTAMGIPTADSKTPLDQVKGGSRFNLPDDDLLSRARCSLSSALKRFTVLFGWEGVVPLRYGRQA